jgi:predicted phosphodiesterase
MKRLNLLLFAILLSLGLAESSSIRPQSPQKNVSSKVTATASTPAAPAAMAPPRVTLPSPLTLPMAPGSLKIAVFGDMGSGKPEQFDVARMMNTYRLAFPFDTVLSVGDNIYGSNTAADMKAKFEDPYKVFFENGVKFYATIGNHDSSNEKNYELFNMKGEEFYKFEKDGVSFYALNSTYMDQRQLDWINAKMAADTNKWKIAYFHHPPFSSGKFHGSDKKMREVLHPLFIKYGVDVVFTGHDHFYERVVPQDGITYFVTGSGGQLRKGDLKKGSPLTAVGFDTDLAFMLVEFVKDEMHFQTISRMGKTVDSGVIKRRER